MALLVLLLVTPVVFLLFIQFEERERPEASVLVVIGLLLVEALIYPSQNEVQGGVFHPSVGGQAVRLPELVIPLALLARVMVRGLPRKVGPTAIAWTVFVTWLAIGVPIGVLMGNPFNLVLFQAKAVIYLGGGFALVAGVPAARLAHATIYRSLLLGLGLVVVLSTPSALAGTSMELDLPLLPGASLGRLSPDAATILGTIAVVGLLLEGARRRRRPLIALAAVPLLLSAFMATQRAAVLGVAVAVLVLLGAAVGSTWSRRIRSTPTEALILACVLLVPVLVTISYKAALSTSPRTEIVPFAEVVSDTFTAQSKAQSAATRRGLWREGLSQATTYPITGWGLGKTYSVEQAARPGEALVGGGFHNIAVDLIVRRGIVGLALFAVAMAYSMRDALLTWRRHADPFVAVFCLACASALVGLVAKAMVESVFEKFRLATLFGLLAGAIASAATSVNEPMTEPARENAVEHA